MVSQRKIDGRLRLNLADSIGGNVHYEYLADGISIVERNDYYPLGKRYGNTTNTIPNNKYRYSNKEEQSFVNVPYLDYGARMYDPQFRLSWNGVDKLAEKYYGISPYAFCAGNPIRLVDADGKKLYFATGVSNEFKQKFAETIKYMNSKGTADDIAKLQKSNEIYYINEVESIYNANFNAQTRTINWDANHLLLTDDNLLLSPATVLSHEAAHAQKYDEIIHSNNTSRIQEYNNSIAKGSDKQYGRTEERRVITSKEQTSAQKHGDINDNQVTRKNHKGSQANVNISNMHPDEISKHIYESNNQYIDN